MSLFSTPLIEPDGSNSRRRKVPQPEPSSPDPSISSYPPPLIQTVIYQNLSPKLKENIPYISETLRIVVIRVGQDANVEAALIRTALNGSILVFSIWQDASQKEKLTCIYKTINQQLVIFKILLQNRPIIVLINAGATRGSKCFFASNTYVKGGSGFNFGLQSYNRWVVPGWNPVCPDYLPEHFRGMDAWEEDLEIDFIGKHIRHTAYPPRRLYFLSLCFPCCLCPQICIANFGNFYPMQERDLAIFARTDDQIKILEISNASVDDCDFSVGGILPPIKKEGPIVNNHQYATLLKKTPEAEQDYSPPRANMLKGGASGSAVVPNPLMTTPSSTRRPASSRKRTDRINSSINDEDDKNRSEMLTFQTIPVSVELVESPK